MFTKMLLNSRFNKMAEQLEVTLMREHFMSYLPA